ncbi:MAG: tetratricopeptide repeat protein [Myxococcales bacterium]
MSAAGFGSREVSRMLGLSVGRIRGFVRAGFLDPARGPRGELRFTFRDLVLLRTAQGLVQSTVPARRVRRALSELRRKLPPHRPLSGLHIAAEGRHVVVWDGDGRWHPESGQLLFDFDAATLLASAAPLMREDRGRSAEDWYAWAVELEESSPGRATDAYRRAIELDPRHAAAHQNLGCLLHEAGQVMAAVDEFKLALAAEPGDAMASFNLGVALQDLGKLSEAAAAYEGALARDPDLADAHFNLGQLHERAGRRGAALRHFAAYRKLERKLR